MTPLRIARAAALAATLVVVGSASADEPDEPTAADVEQAPPPGNESGRTDRSDTDSLWRDIGQAALIPPRVVVEVAAAPVRAGVYVFDRYRLVDRYKQIFFDDTYTYGVYPTVIVDASYGATVGARAVHRNLFGAREHLAVRAGFGGEYRERASLRFRSGDRFGMRTHLELAGEFEQRPSDRFYGIGNGVDPVLAHHRQQLQRARATVDVRAVANLHLRGSGAITDLEYGRSLDDVTPIDEVYLPMTLTGFTTGIRNLYGELELRWDSRRRAAMDQHAVFERGLLLGAFGGRVHQLAAMGNDYWRYGGELQGYIPIGTGPRVLMTRVRTEAVTGDLADVAFTQLPEIGGKFIMRGYPRERFRDRLAIVTTAEYTWDLSRWFMASTFVDVGRVYSGWTELHYEDMRVGYGASLQMHMSEHFLGAISVATSIDGGWFVDFSLDPIYSLDPRVERQ